MIILKGAITTLASEGRLTLQVPQYNIGFKVSNYISEIEEVPDEWIMTLRSSNGRPAVGRESGFWFLTRKGCLLISHSDELDMDDIHDEEHPYSTDALGQH